MMKIKFISSLAVTLILSLTGFTQASAQSFKDRHNQAQKELLAGHKNNKMDRTTIGNMVQQDVVAREEGTRLSKESANLIDDLLKEAATHIGKRYVLGSKGPATFDCSGFSGYVYRQFGYSIGACSRDQYKQGKAIDRKDLRKGDLVFFTSRSSGNNVGHVGIVWDVNRETGAFKFIHASLRGVKISDFEGYYVNRYVGAKRIIE